MQFNMTFPWWLYHKYATLVLKISYHLCLLFEYVDDNLHESMQTVHVGDQKKIFWTVRLRSYYCKSRNCQYCWNLRGGKRTASLVGVTKSFTCNNNCWLL